MKEMYEMRETCQICLALCNIVFFFSKTSLSLNIEIEYQLKYLN